MSTEEESSTRPVAWFGLTIAGPDMPRAAALEYNLCIGGTQRQSY